MIREFLSLIRRFRSDEDGAFLVIFGVMAIVLVATSGAVVDFTSVEQARTRAQVALDSAALGLQPRIYDSSTPDAELLRGEAENVLRERLTANDVSWAVCEGPNSATLPCASVDDAAINLVDGSLELTASIQVPMSFVSLVGINSMTAGLVSEATRKRLDIEVAMVLDNSGSMAWSNRMNKLKEAANCAVNVLLNGDCASTATDAGIENVKIGIVPFTEFVNVGTDARTESWFDATGISQVARDNFDTDDYDGNEFAGPINRLDLFTQMGVDWKGCVEARLPPYDTDDTVPDASAPDTLFAPAMAPDEPRNYPNDYLDDEPAACTRKAPRFIWTQTKYSCDKNGTSAYRYESATCSGGDDVLNVYQVVSELGVVTTQASSTAPQTLFNNPHPGANSYSDTYQSNGNGDNSDATNRRTRTWTYVFSDRELQERVCKYNGASVNSWRDGPNADCPSSALLPLTADKGGIKARINSMNADGGTNIHQGAIWGFHMLSPTEPLTEGKLYSAGATSKVMILMTDGENTHAAYNNMNGASWYTAYGFPYNGRLGTVGDSTGELQDLMDVRLATTCENAKDAGITIYTIGLSSPNHVKALLTACASDAGKAKFPSDSDNLTDVFKEIASELANLRLAK